MPARFLSEGVLNSYRACPAVSKWISAPYLFRYSRCAVPGMTPVSWRHDVRAAVEHAEIDGEQREDEAP
jgi:hypothetical protein